VLFNEPVLPPGHPDAVSETDVVKVARVVAAALASAGFDARMLAARAPLGDLVRELERDRPDVVFNLIEGFGGQSAGATYVTGVLELLGLAYTGSPVEALARCVSKGAAKALLKGHGLPTAPFEVVPIGEAIEEWRWHWPVVVKPDCEDGSLGIDQRSIVTDRQSAAQRVTWIHETYAGAAIVEEYLPGNEFNIGVLELPEAEPLPVAEVVYEPIAGAWPILTYNAKWSAGSQEDRASVVRCPAHIDEALAGELRGLAVAAFTLTGCRDYGRVDLRLDRHGRPMILEVNPNPDIGPAAGWARALRSSGRDYAATIAGLARRALERGGKRARQ
jgi:D-alanine-D-alanine ligase